MSPRTGVGQVIRPRTAGGSSARGVTLRLSEETAFVSFPDFTVVPFDEASGDSDFVSTAALDSSPFGAGAVAIGQAIVIPDDMPPDSLYTVSGDVGMSPVDLEAGVDGQWGLQFAIVQGDTGDWPGEVGEQQIMWATPGASLSGTQVVHVTIPRQVYPVLLSSGDYLYAAVWAVGTFGGDAQLITGRANITLEFWKTP